MAARVHIGTSGWMYPGWASVLYPGVPRAKWLAHASRVFTGLEVNATFYRQQRPDTFRRWRDEVPDDFRFAIKAHRFITHYKRLKSARASIDLLRGPAQVLGDKLAAVLWQLPSNFACDLDRLRGFLPELARWPETRHAIELRHPSWFVPAVADLLGEAGIAVCIASAPDFPMWLEVTTDLVYVRLHGHTRKYVSSYHPAHLRRCADRVKRWRRQRREVHVYFDNDAEAAAPRDARRLLELVGVRRSGARERHRPRARRTVPGGPASPPPGPPPARR